MKKGVEKLVLSGQSACTERAIAGRGVEKDHNTVVPTEMIENKIFLVRGQKVMFDKDLADLYCILTRNLNKAVNRNIDRFPEDFMFSLTKEEKENLKFHFGTSSWGGTRKQPRAFTEHGILMLSSVLNSARAIQVNIAIMRAFVKIRQIISFNKELAKKLSELENKLGRHDQDIISLFSAINKITRYEEKPKGKWGFI